MDELLATLGNYPCLSINHHLNDSQPEPSLANLLTHYTQVNNARKQELEYYLLFDHHLGYSQPEPSLTNLLMSNTQDHGTRVQEFEETWPNGQDDLAWLSNFNIEAPTPFEETPLLTQDMSIPFEISPTMENWEFFSYKDDIP